jgi:hypothetical protein
VGREEGHISNAECVVIGQVVALKRAVCLRSGMPDGCWAKPMSQQASLC